MTALNFNNILPLLVINISSRYSIGYGLYCPGLKSRQWLDIILIYKKRADQTCMGSGVLPSLLFSRHRESLPVIRRPKLDDDHCLSKVEVKNESVPPTYITSYHGQGHIYVHLFSKQNVDWIFKH